jgi:hypothetical protein
MFSCGQIHGKVEQNKGRDVKDGFLKKFHCGLETVLDIEELLFLF